MPAKTRAQTKSRGQAAIVPYGDRVVVKQIKQEEVRASGIVIPDTAKERPQLGEVISVGPGRLDENGKRVPIEVKVGERVLFAKYSGQEVPRGILPGDEEEYMVLKEADILARVPG